MAQLKNIPVIRSSHFSQTRGEKGKLILFQEASVLEHTLGVSQFRSLDTLANRIYDDACDAGFFLESAKTGRKELMFLSQEVSHDGDAKFFIFTPKNSTLNFELHLLWT